MGGLDCGVWGVGVKPVMRSLENRLHNGVVEGGGLPPHHKPLPCLKRNKGAISIPYLMARLLKNSIHKSKQKQSRREVSCDFL